MAGKGLGRALRPALKQIARFRCQGDHTQGEGLEAAVRSSVGRRACQGTQFAKVQVLRRQGRDTHTPLLPVPRPQPPRRRRRQRDHQKKTVLGKQGARIVKLALPLRKGVVPKALLGHDPGKREAKPRHASWRVPQSMRSRGRRGTATPSTRRKSSKQARAPQSQRPSGTETRPQLSQQRWRGERCRANKLCRVQKPSAQQRS